MTNTKKFKSSMKNTKSLNGTSNGKMEVINKFLGAF